MSRRQSDGLKTWDGKLRKAAFPYNTPLCYSNRNSRELMHIAVRDAMEGKFAIRYIGGRDHLAAEDPGERTDK